MSNPQSDKLFLAAMSFDYFLDKEIVLKFGHKGKLDIVNVVFDVSNFHHLAGLHKLTDLPQISKRSARKVFQEILDGKITLNDISKSTFFNLIEERLDILTDLPRTFSNKGIGYKFLKQSRSWRANQSKIRWKYLLEFQNNKHKSGYIFFNQYRNLNSKYVAISDFMKKDKNYGNDNERLILLQVIQKFHDQETILFQSSSFKS